MTKSYSRKTQVLVLLTAAMFVFANSAPAEVLPGTVNEVVRY